MTALSHFSIACWAWNPTASSSISGLGARACTTLSSPCALRARTRARSGLSGLDKTPTLVQRLIQHRPFEVPPFLDVPGAYDDHVESHFQTAKLASQTSSLGASLRDLTWLDHEEVQIAVGTRFAAGAGAEKDHPGPWRGLRQEAPRLLDQRLVRHRSSHGIVVTACDGRDYRLRAQSGENAP